jgi:hypothetical protein
VAIHAATDSSATGLINLNRLTPHACSATNSRSADRRPKATSNPSSSDIGMVSASADGSKVAMTRSTTGTGTPFEMKLSAYSMRYGMINMNVKTSSPVTKGHRTSRITYLSIVRISERSHAGARG